MSGYMEEEKGSELGAAAEDKSPSRAPSSMGLCYGFLFLGECNMSATMGPETKRLHELKES